MQKQVSSDGKSAGAHQPLQLTILQLSSCRHVRQHSTAVSTNSTEKVTKEGSRLECDGIVVLQIVPIISTELNQLHLYDHDHDSRLLINKLLTKVSKKSTALFPALLTCRINVINLHKEVPGIASCRSSYWVGTSIGTARSLLASVERHRVKKLRVIQSKLESIDLQICWRSNVELRKLGIGEVGLAIAAGAS